MIRKGTRVVIVDADEALRVSAVVSNGEKGVILRLLKDGFVEVLVDGDTDEWGWDMPRSCVKRVDANSIISRVKGGKIMIIGKLECGCEVHQDNDTKVEIAYCPLHKAAKVLYMACYAAGAEIEDGSPHKARLILKKATNEAEGGKE